MEAGNSESITVRQNVDASRFEVQVGGLLAIAEYRLAPDVITFTHTRVPPELSGRGIATRLIETGLAFARAQGLKVIPQCRFTAAYLRKHPQDQDLLGPEGLKFLAP